MSRHHPPHATHPYSYQQKPTGRWLQDFTKLMDVQFLDNLRRGASINYADMQRNPVPKTLQVGMQHTEGMQLLGGWVGCSW